MDGFGILLIIAIFILSSLSSNNKKNKKAKTNSQSAQQAQPVNTPVQRAPQQRPAPAAPRQAAPQQPRYYDSTCMEADTRHDHDRRVEQLKDFLKDGIITREEYNILLAKYENRR